MRNENHKLEIARLNHQLKSRKGVTSRYVDAAPSEDWLNIGSIEMQIDDETIRVPIDATEEEKDTVRRNVRLRRKMDARYRGAIMQAEAKARNFIARWKAERDAESKQILAASRREALDRIIEYHRLQGATSLVAKYEAERAEIDKEAKDG